MATTVRPRGPAAIDNPAYQAFLTLRVGFVVAPILFGLDKFTNLLTNWTTYLAPAIDRLIPASASQAMLAVGVIEIAAGLVVAVRPKLGGYLARAKDPPPGNLVLWRGLSRLTDILLGFELPKRGCG